MANILKCRVCNGNVSSDAKNCPHCGDPYIIEERRQFAEKEKEKAEALQKYKYIKELRKEHTSANEFGTCWVCGASKKSERYSDYSGEYYVPGCKCSIDDYCKHIYGITMSELTKLAFS